MVEMAENERIIASDDEDMELGEADLRWVFLVLSVRLQMEENMILGTNRICSGQDIDQ